MKNTLILLLALIGQVALASGSECITIGAINNFKGLSSQEIVFYTAGRREYLVKTFMCPELRFAENVGFRTFPRGSAFVCSGDDLLVYDSFAPRRPINVCGIRSIARRK